MYPLNLNLVKTLDGIKYFVTGNGEFHEGDILKVRLRSGHNESMEFLHIHATINSEQDMKLWYIEGEIIGEPLEQHLEDVEIQSSNNKQEAKTSEGFTPQYGLVTFNGMKKEYVFATDIKGLKKGDLVLVDSSGSDNIATFSRYSNTNNYGARKTIIRKIEKDRNYYEGYSAGIVFNENTPLIIENVMLGIKKMTKEEVINSLLDKNDYETIKQLQEEEKKDSDVYTKFRIKEIYGEAV